MNKRQQKKFNKKLAKEREYINRGVQDGLKNVFKDNPEIAALLDTCCFCGQIIETQYYNVWQVEGHSKIVCIGCHAELEKKYDATYLPPEDVFKFNNKGELIKCTK